MSTIAFIVYVLGAVVLTFAFSNHVRRHPEKYQPLPRSLTYITGVATAVMLWPLMLPFIFHDWLKEHKS